MATTLMRQFVRPVRSKFISRGLSSTSPEFIVFPREKEGNVYDDNWSLVVDGVTPTGNAYRNPRLPLVTSKLGLKVEGGKIEISKLALDGNFAVREAGDSITHDDFATMHSTQQDALSVEQDLYFEDAGLGALANVRIGVRVVSSNPAYALVARSLLVPVPPRPVDHRARFNAWNQDPRWSKSQMQWTGDTYVLNDNSVKEKGQRPIVAFIGGTAAPDALAVQFAEKDGVIVGATVVSGDAVPVRGIIDAIGHAASVLIGAEQMSGVVLPSVSVFHGDSTVVVVEADDSVVAAAVEKKVLYGAYHNYISASGVSALWNGAVVSASSVTGAGITVGSKAVASLDVQNLAHPAKHFVFYSKDAATATLTEEEAVKRLVQLTDESKAAVCAEIVRGAKLTVAGSAAAALAAK